jgi:ubiquinone/menaquinone biosynthesis C-methylase UbiE
MGFYSRVILPRLLDWSMSGPEMAQYRHQLLADVSGQVLEIGFGTGLNLAYYPEQVQQLTTIDINPGMNEIARRRIQASSIQVQHQILSSDRLPMADSTFDSVVSTWTLCSIANVQAALQEIHRVLKPGGKFFFVEHGLSPEPNIQTWQHRLTPIQKIIGDGCHLDRNIKALVEQVFPTVCLEEFYEQSVPKTFGYFYKGTAQKGTAQKV